MLKNKKQYLPMIFFLLLGIGVILSSLIEHGFSKNAGPGLIAGALALAYGFLRSKLLRKN